MAKKVKGAAAKGKEDDVHSGALEGNHRERILKAALVLLSKRGRDAVTTRAVAEAARVQPPILYRLFGDKAGLLNAVAEYGFGAYMAKKRQPKEADDPVEFLRAGWRIHVEFGLTHPELYLLMYADPHPPGRESRAAKRSHRVLLEHMRRVAAAGRLRVSEERAAHLFHAAACGLVITLLGMNAAERDDLSLSEAACEAALVAIVTEQAVAPTPTTAAVAGMLQALISEDDGARQGSGKAVFTDAERSMLIEWLGRLREVR